MSQELFLENLDRVMELAKSLSRDAQNALWLLCTHADENGYVIADAELLEEWAPGQYAANEAQESLDALERARIISSDPDDYRKIHIQHWETPLDYDYRISSIGRRKATPEVRLQSPEIKLLKEIVLLAEELGITKVALADEWHMPRQQIYKYLKGQRLPSSGKFAKMKVTHARLLRLASHTSS